MNPPNTAAQTERTAQALKKTSGLFRAAAMSNGFAEHANQLETDLSSALAQLRQAREALEAFANGSLDVSETAVIIGYPNTKDALDKARAFLTTTAPKETP